MSYYSEDMGPDAPVLIRYYRTATGRCPFRDWLDFLDGKIRTSVDFRLARLRRGHWGDFKYLGGGVYELRFHAGAGHRIYFGRDGNAVVLLLNAGNKSDQSADIEKARRFWRDYSSRDQK